MLGLLLRRKFVDVVSAVRDKGLDLFRALAKHLDNYSMMQVLLKLIVPQILTVSGGERARERHARGPPRAFRARQHEERTCVLTAARALLSLASD